MAAPWHQRDEKTVKAMERELAAQGSGEVKAMRLAAEQAWSDYGAGMEQAEGSASRVCGRVCTTMTP